MQTNSSSTNSSHLAGVEESCLVNWQAGQVRAEDVHVHFWDTLRGNHPGADCATADDILLPSVTCSSTGASQYDMIPAEPDLLCGARQI